MADRQFIPCLTCGATFKQKRDSEKYCCRACYEVSRAIQPKICIHCNQSYVKKANQKGSSYCSEECMKASLRVKPHTCVTCGALFSPVKYKASEHRFVGATGRHNCSKECIDAWKAKTKSEYMRANREKFSGANCWNWKGACLRRNRSYRGSDWNVIAERMRQRDGMSCKHCGMSQADHLAKWSQKLEVHHIVPFYEFTDHKKANRPSNLVTLCKSCHMTADRSIKSRQILMFFADEPRKQSTAPRRIGQDAQRSKLKDDEVVAIKIRLRDGCKQQVIADEFGVSSQLISAINVGHVWSHIKIADPANLSA